MPTSRTRVILLVLVGAVLIVGTAGAASLALRTPERAPAVIPNQGLTAPPARRVLPTITDPVVLATYCDAVHADYDTLHQFDSSAGFDLPVLQSQADAAARVAAAAPSPYREQWESVAAGYAAMADGLTETDGPLLAASSRAGQALDAPLRRDCGVAAP